MKRPVFNRYHLPPVHHWICAAFCVAVLCFGAPGEVAAREQEPGTDEIVAWLDLPETQWVATAYLQQVPQTALPLLLQPGRTTSGAHERVTAHMLALAKLGEPAIPAIEERVVAILSTSDSGALASAHALINVLGAMGPAAVPALVHIADASAIPYVTSDALDEIVRLEPTSPGGVPGGAATSAHSA
jgi:hypothetical protein